MVRWENFCIHRFYKPSIRRFLQIVIKPWANSASRNLASSLDSRLSRAAMKPRRQNSKGVWHSTPPSRCREFTENRCRTSTMSGEAPVCEPIPQVIPSTDSLFFPLGRFFLLSESYAYQVPITNRTHIALMNARFIVSPESGFSSLMAQARNWEVGSPPLKYTMKPRWRFPGTNNEIERSKRSIVRTRKSKRGML